MHIKQLDCPCKRTKCERYQNCDACRVHHHSSKQKIMTACERLKAKEERKNNRKSGGHG